MSKLEKRIKEKLEQRELTPSSGAWERVAEELGEEKKSTSKTSSWFIAAAISVLLLTLSLLFFTTNKAKGVEQYPLVDKEHSPVESVQQKTQLVESNNAISKQKDTSLSNSLNAKNLIEKEIVIVSKSHQDSENDLVIEETETLTTISMGPDKEVASNKLIENKLQEVLALVNAMENDSITVTDQEIDSLLMQAQKELLTDKLINTNTEVDALTLLNEVELELFEDDRDQLFDTLKDSFFKLRTAVAARNK